MASAMKQGAATADRTGAPDKVRVAGVLCAVGGASWLVNGLVFLVISQPDGAAFVIAEAVRERGILHLIAQGHPNPSIAQQLHLSPKTVCNYISNIFAKLQVADRAQAIIRTREAGMGT